MIKKMRLDSPSAVENQIGRKKTRQLEMFFSLSGIETIDGYFENPKKFCDEITERFTKMTGNIYGVESCDVDCYIRRCVESGNYNTFETIVYDSENYLDSIYCDVMLPESRLRKYYDTVIKARLGARIFDAFVSILKFCTYDSCLCIYTGGRNADEVISCMASQVNTDKKYILKALEFGIRYGFTAFFVLDGVALPDGKPGCAVEFCFR